MADDRCFPSKIINVSDDNDFDSDDSLFECSSFKSSSLYSGSPSASTKSSGISSGSNITSNATPVANTSEDVDFTKQPFCDTNELHYEWRLSEELLDVAERELGETHEVRTRCLSEMRMWISENINKSAPSNWKSPLLCDAKFLLRFLRSQKFNVSKACRVLHNYIQLRSDHPEWFQNLDIHTDHVVSDLAKTGFLHLLPECDADGRKVLFNHVAAIDTYKYKSADIVRLFVMTLEMLMLDEECQIRGISYVFYCKGISLSHIRLWSPSEVSELMTRCERNLAIRHSSIKCVHLPFAMRAVLEFVKQFLSAKIRQRIEVVTDGKKGMIDKLKAANISKEVLDDHKLSTSDISQPETTSKSKKVESPPQMIIYSREELGEQLHDQFCRSRRYLMSLDRISSESSEKGSNNSLIRDTVFTKEMRSASTSAVPEKHSSSNNTTTATTMSSKKRSDSIWSYLNVFQ